MVLAADTDAVEHGVLEMRGDIVGFGLSVTVVVGVVVIVSYGVCVSDRVVRAEGDTLLVPNSDACALADGDVVKVG